jgi:hypothetical protein
MLLTQLHQPDTLSRPKIERRIWNPREQSFFRKAENVGQKSTSILSHQTDFTEFLKSCKRYTAFNVCHICIQFLKLLKNGNKAKKDGIAPPGARGEVVV